MRRSSRGTAEEVDEEEECFNSHPRMSRPWATLGATFGFQLYLSV